MSQASLRKAAHILRQGGIVAYATEYCFGLGCDPHNPHALQRLLRIKRRSWTKGLIVLAANTDQLAGFVADIPRQALDMWPGPVTCVLASKDTVSKLICGRHATIAVRVTAHEQARDLCLACDSALVSTSANRSGQMPVRSYREAVRRLKGMVDFILPGRVGTLHRPTPIIDPVRKTTLRD